MTILTAGASAGHACFDFVRQKCLSEYMEILRKRQETVVVKVSVIVPTYNRPQELRLCLSSLVTQSVLPHEVLIADDGSGEETRLTIRQFEQSGACPFALRHIWQEDRGFRKSRILNETGRNATGDYLVFIDGDCMAHRDFVRSHLLFAEPNAILGGRRVEIGTKLTNRVLEGEKPLVTLSIKLLWDSIFGNSRKAEEAIRIENRQFRRFFDRDRISDDGIWGCNFSLYKTLYLAINGFDEDFRYSIEDNDLGIRVVNGGGKVKSARALAIVFHLWHQVRWNFDDERYQKDKNIILQRIRTKQKVCRNGIFKL